MRRLFFALLIAAIAPFGWAFEIAGAVKLLPDEAFPLLQKVSSGFKNPFPDSKSVSLYLISRSEGPLEPILVITPNNPASFIAQAANDELLKRYTYTPHGEKVVGTLLDLELSDAQLVELEEFSTDSSTPITAKLNVGVLLAALQANPDFAQKLSEPKIAPFIAQLAFLETLDVRLSDVNGDSLRAILIAKAQKGTSLAEFFNQRLPKEFPASYARIPVGDSALYGACLFNPEILGKYLGELKASFGAAYPGSFLGSTLPVELTASSNGQMAFWTSPSLGLYQYAAGQWSDATTEKLLNAVLKNAAEARPEVKPALTKVFSMENSTVWSLAIDNDPLGYTALYKGGLLSAPTRESLYGLFETLEGTEEVPNNLAKAFTCYPTIALQAYLKPRSLLSEMKGASPIGIPDAITNLFDDTPVYVAVSLSSGKMGVTLDIPWGLVQLMDKFILYNETSAAPEAPAISPTH